MRKVSTALICAVFCTLQVEAEAKTRPVKSRNKAFHVPTLTQLAKMGELALIESHADGTSRQVVIFSLINASPDTVYDSVMNVTAYPKILKTVVSARITRKAKERVAYDWVIEMPFVTLSGNREQRGRRPHVVDVRGVSGNLRGTRERWELFPVDGGKRTLAAFYRAIDVETGGMLLKMFVKLEPSMEQGANLATGFVHMRELRRHIEKLPDPGKVTPKGPVPPFHQLQLGPHELNLPKLETLLTYGQLALIESYNDGSLKQVALLTVVNSSKKKLASIVQAPGKYPEFIPSFAEQKVKPMGKNKLRMEWELEVPLVNLTGVSVMTIEDTGSVDVVAVEGDITRGRWRWDFHALSDKSTIPVHYAYTDIRESSWVTRTLVEKQPLFEHGIVIASGTIALHAMKARAEGRR